VRVVGPAGVLLAAAVLLGRSPEPAGKTVINVRLRDQQVAAAYRPLVRALPQAQHAANAASER
jgi:hypothetical protein